MDYGKDSLKKTLINLPNNSYFGAGLDFENAYKPLIKIIDNKKIGFLSFSEWGFGCFDNESKVGYSWIGHRNTNQLIKKTKKGVDLLIVQVHAGLEGIDLPLPEWRDKYKLLIDLGADIVIGHHPHVPQGCEKYKNKHIFYSLGNFYMDLSQKKKEKNFILSLELKESNNIRVEVIPIEMSNNIVKVVDDNDFINKLNRGLNSEEYYSKINEQCVTLWEERYKKYYFSSLNKLNVQMGIRYNIKKLLQFFLNKEIDDTLLLHNLKIESHRFAVERYLLLKNKEKNG
jgi:poly-gamma-glutamate synthesis protein (capsule biosynthesis protein)